jgi:hypothetical protein
MKIKSIKSEDKPERNQQWCSENKSASKEYGARKKIIRREWGHPDFSKPHPQYDPIKDCFYQLEIGTLDCTFCLIGPIGQKNKSVSYCIDYNISPMLFAEQLKKTHAKFYTYKAKTYDF